MSQDQTWFGPVATSSGLTAAGWMAWRAPLAAFAGLAQHPVVGGYRAKVGALVQQDRPDFVRGQVSEPGAVQRVQDRLPLGGGQRPRLDPLACGTGAALAGGGLVRWRRYQVACGTPAAAHAARVPIPAPAR